MLEMTKNACSNKSHFNCISNITPVTSGWHTSAYLLTRIIKTQHQTTN